MSMSNEEKVIKFYVLCNKLKNTIRKGWLDWNVSRERIESIADHIYSTQMLAIGMCITYKYDIDLYKVAFMLAFHEIGEISIGDKNPFEMTKEEKERIEHEAVHKLLKEYDTEDNFLENTFLEFDAHETKESKFAFLCDKLECDLQSKLYGEEGCVDLSRQDGNDIMKNPIVKKYLDEGCTWEEMWIKFGQEVYPYDDNFRKVSNYALTHKINN